MRWEEGVSTQTCAAHFTQIIRLGRFERDSGSDQDPFFSSIQMERKVFVLNASVLFFKGRREEENENKEKEDDRCESRKITAKMLRRAYKKREMDG